jgi:glucan phosphorylase
MLAITWLHRPTDHLRAAHNAQSAIKVQAYIKDASLQAFELEVSPRLGISVASLAHSAYNQSSAIAKVINRCIDDKTSAAESTSQHVDRLSSFPV